MNPTRNQTNGHKENAPCDFPNDIERLSQEPPSDSSEDAEGLEKGPVSLKNIARDLLLTQNTQNTIY